MAKTKKTPTKKLATKKSDSKNKNVIRELVDTNNVTQNTKSINNKSKLRPKRILTLIVFVVILAAFFYYFKSLFVVAIINGKPLTRLALDQELEKNYGAQTMDNLVTKSLIFQEAKKQNVSVSDKEVQDQIDSIDKSLKNQGSSLQQALTYQGQTMNQLKESILIQKTVEGILKGKITVSDDDIKKYFDDNAATTYKGKKLDDVKNEIKTTLEQQKLSTEFQTWIQDIRGKAKIYYFKSF